MHRRKIAHHRSSYHFLDDAKVLYLHLYAGKIEWPVMVNMRSDFHNMDSQSIHPSYLFV